VQGRALIDQIHIKWGGLPGQLGQGGISHITVSYKDDTDGDNARVNFVTGLQGAYPGIVNAINRGRAAQHAEIGLGFDGQNNVGIFGDLIAPALRTGIGSGASDQRPLDGIKSKTLDNIRTRRSNPNRPQNTKRITFEAQYQRANVQNLGTEIGNIQWR
jgi:hypothetical protein